MIHRICISLVCICRRLEQHGAASPEVDQNHPLWYELMTIAASDVASSIYSHIRHIKIYCMYVWGDDAGMCIWEGAAYREHATRQKVAGIAEHQLNCRPA